VQIPALAARCGEALVEESLRALLKESPEHMNAPAVTAMLEQGVQRSPITSVDVEPVSLAVFDELLSGNEVAA
jgi:hypothetical protein